MPPEVLDGGRSRTGFWLGKQATNKSSQTRCDIEATRSSGPLLHIPIALAHRLHFEVRLVMSDLYPAVLPFFFASSSPGLVLGLFVPMLSFPVLSLFLFWFVSVWTRTEEEMSCCDVQFIGLAAHETRGYEY